MIFTIIILTVFVHCQGDEPVYLHSKGDGSFTNIVEKGILVSGKYDITFSVKACAQAVIVFSDIVSVTNTRGHYFLLMLGTEENTHVRVADSCFRCSRAFPVTAKVMQCKSFVDFWVRWDGKGRIEVGTGKTLGDNRLLDVHGRNNSDYPVFCIAVTSTNGQKAEWKFTREPVPPHLYQPLPHGYTLVEVSDQTAPGSDVIDIILKPANRSASFTLTESSAKLFILENNTIKLSKKLDFDSQPFHVIQLRSNTGLNTSLTVKVTQERSRVNNDNLQVTVSDLITIPEQLPAGSLIGWNLTVSDTDRNYVHSFTINGSMASFFSITPDGDLQLSKVVDRDEIGNVNTGGITLTVSDFKPNTVKVIININITDINDNPPICADVSDIISLEENSTEDIKILTLTCTDQDTGPNGRVVMSVIEDSSKAQSFYLDGNQLYVKAGSLDYEGGDSHMEHVVIRVADTPQTGAALTSSLLLLFQIMPKDEFNPVWILPKEQFPYLLILDTSPVGTLVGTFKIEDKDEDEDSISYTLESGEIRKTFSINAETGDLTTLVTKDTSKAGYETEYSFTVTASSGQKLLPKVVTVKIVTSMQQIAPRQIEARHFKPDTDTMFPNNIPKQSSTIPIFDKPVYVIDKPTSRDWRITLLNFHVTIPGSQLRPSVVVNGPEGSKYFRVRQSLNSWKLVLNKNVNAENLPSDIVLKAFSESDLLATSTSHVLINDQVTECDVTTSLPVVRQDIVQDTFMANIGSPPTTANVHVTRAGRGEFCSTHDYTSERALTMITIAESVALFLLFVKRKKLVKATRPKRIKKQMKKIKRPVRQEPIGCEEESKLRESTRRKSFQSRDLKTSEKCIKQGVMTLAEVDNDDLYPTEKEDLVEILDANIDRGNIETVNLSSDIIYGDVAGREDEDDVAASVCNESQIDEYERSRFNPDGCLSDLSRNYCPLEDSDASDEIIPTLEKNDERYETKCPLPGSISADQFDRRQAYNESSDDSGHQQVNSGSSGEIDLPPLGRDSTGSVDYPRVKDEDPLDKPLDNRG